MRKIKLLLVFITSASFALAQNLEVQTLTYQSGTRDTIIEFPDIDHNDYEKIIMHYSMRCKNAQVSTGANRNLGCGEWDYSCNTYLVDESKVDSFKQVSPEFDFVGRGGDTFSFTNESTYSYTQRTQKRVEQTNVILPREFEVFNGDLSADYSFGAVGQGLSLQYIITSEDLTDANIADGRGINGMNLAIEDGSVTLSNLKVRATWLEDIQGDLDLENWTEVYFLNTFLDADNNQLNFYEPIEWDGTSHLIIWITYDQATGDGLTIKSSDEGEAAARYNDPIDNKYWAFGPSGYVDIKSDFSDIQDEITIAFWHYGFDNLPVNSTLLEAVDDNNVRQVNIHLPWGNGQIYWDCGSDGNYDRINKTAATSEIKNQWNHFAFTKNANTGVMRIYLNGALWHEGTDRYRKIDIKNFKLGQNFGGNNYNYSRLDDFQIYNKEIEEANISSIMNGNLDAAFINDRFLHYDFNSDSNALSDISGNGRNGTVNGSILAIPYPAEVSDNAWTESVQVLNQSLRQDLQTIQVIEEFTLDSVPNLPQRVDQYTVNGTDLELVSTDYYYSNETSYVFNQDGEVVDSVSYSVDGVLERGELNYFSKRNMEFEVMSFVTPYGIGIDFGEEGHTWTFDVTHLGPILKGKKRLYLTRGGQWQEEMDIRFEYIEGIPDRDVLDINNLWPTSGTISYQNIQSDWRFEPRQIIRNPNAAEHQIKMAITGHRQEGEFVPRDHELTFDIDGILLPNSWRVWKECADNPIYPQGGTWIYDRAGWCPGMATDIKEIEINNYFNRGDTIEVDYNIPVVQGASSYIVSSQLVEYGAPNKTLDASIADVLYPTTKIEYARFNPTCQSPKVVLKNHGSETLREVMIDYGIVGKGQVSYLWKGELGFLQSEEVDLYFLGELQVLEEGDVFYATIRTVNDQTDSYSKNDRYETEVALPDHFDQEFIIDLRTNSRPQETEYRIFDKDGNQVLYRGGNLSPNRNYRDTLRGLTGCYTLILEDQGDDGLDFWANPNQGFGYLQVKDNGTDWNVVGDDFGKFVEYNFTIGQVTSAKDLEEASLMELYPNPVREDLFIKELNGFESQVIINVTDQLGREYIRYSTSKDQIENRSIRNIDGLDAGVYFITVSDGQKQASKKFVKI